MTKRAIKTNTASTAVVRQQGLSLVELMIALAIGAALIGGMIQIFSSNNAAFRTQQSVSRMQENARFAFHFISRELRQVGYRGCAGQAPQNQLDLPAGSDDEFLFDFGRSIHGWAGDNTPTELDFGGHTPKDDSDVVLIRRAGIEQVETQDGSPASDISDIELTTPHELEGGDILTISDCQEVTTFQVSDASSGSASLDASGSMDPGNTGTGLGHTFGNGSHISRTLVTRFWIADNPDGEPALYRKVNKEDAEELVPGVERMVLEYGVDDDKQFDIPSPAPPEPDCELTDEGDGEVDAYQDVSTMDRSNCDWQRAVGARVSLLVRSPSDRAMVEGGGGPAQQTFRFDGTTETRSDGYLRHVVNTTIAFRNRLP